MAKKKKRKLKKSVKVGCSVIILLLVLGIVGLVRSCAMPARDSVSQNDEQGDLVESAVDKNAEMAEKLQAFIHQYTRLDTTNISISVYDLSAKEQVFAWHDKQLMPPASCMKLLTAVTALKRLGMDHRYVEQAFACGEVRGGTLYGALILQFDDDPLCLDLGSLIRSVRDKGVERIEGSVIVDMLRNDTLKAHPSAATWDIPYHKLPPLLRGRGYVERNVRQLLAQNGISVKQNPLLCPNLIGIDIEQEPIRWHNQVNGMVARSRCLAKEENRLTDLISPMIIHSSNIKADALCWHIDNYMSRFVGTTGTACQQMHAFIEENLQYPEHMREGFVINDGSGLSPHNRLNADFLVQLLVYAWRHPDMRNYLLDEALATPAHPVRHGSLLGRMSAPMFRDRVFCKTGTLTTIGASSLSGYIHASDDHWYAFSVINEDSPVAESRIYQDDFCRVFVK